MVTGRGRRGDAAWTWALSNRLHRPHRPHEAAAAKCDVEDTWTQPQTQQQHLQPAAAAAAAAATAAAATATAAAPAAAEARGHVGAAPQSPSRSQQQQRHHCGVDTGAAPTPVVTGTHHPSRPVGHRQNCNDDAFG